MGLSPGERTAGDATKGPNGLPLSVAAVICTRGTRATLGAAVQSVAAELHDGDDLVVVVDDGPLVVEATQLPANARVIHQAASGLGVARQRAIECVMTDLVLFVDDDEI